MAKSSLFKNIKIKIRDFFSVYIYRPIYQKYVKKKYSYLHEDVIHIKIEDIIGWYNENKLLEISFEGNIKSGDWTNKIIARERVLKSSPKYSAMIQRFKDNKPWIQTDLFKKRYHERLLSGSKVKGLNDIKLVEEYYEIHYDRLFRSLKKEGVKPADPSGNIASIYIYIDKNGEILYTRDGNHRLFMALVLGIEEIPVKVWTWHKD